MRRREGPRIVLAAAIVLFAIVSAPRLRLDYLPRAVLPELRVALSLGDAAADPADTTNRWILPIESSIRSLGDVTGTRAELSGDGANFTVRFGRSVDPNVKAARLSSELAPLRAKLPIGGRISVWPSTQAGDRPSLVLAIAGGEAIAKRAADDLRAARGVRDVDVFGIAEPLVDVRMQRDAPDVAVHAADVRNAIEASLAPRALTTKVVVAPSARRLEDVPIRTGTAIVRLGAIADIRPRFADATTVARVNGRPSILIAVRRDDDVSLFTFESSVHDRLRGVTVDEVTNEAAELRAMLVRAAIGAVVASLLLALCGWQLALWIPLSAALAINVFRLAGLPVDAGVIIVALIAFAGLAPFAVTRRPRFAIAALFIALLPLAVAFASSALAPLVVPSARAFFIVGVCAVVGAACGRPNPRRAGGRTIAAATVGRWPFAVGRGSLRDTATDAHPPAREGSGGRRPPLRRGSAIATLMGRLLVGLRRSSVSRVSLRGAAATGNRQPATGSAAKATLRNAASLVLAATTIACALFTFFGERLDPRVESVAEPSRLYIRVSLPEGTTLAQTVSAVDRVEKRLRDVGGIERFWTFAYAGGATISLELEPKLREPAKAQQFQMQLRSRIPFAPGFISIGGSADARAARMSDELEDEPFADENGAAYRFLLQGTDAEELRRTYEVIATRLARYGVKRSAVDPEWPAPSVALALVPRHDTSADEAAAAAEMLAERSSAAREWLLPDGRTARLASYGAPRTSDDAPQRADLFARPLGARTVLDAFELRQSYVPGGATRALGRFVLPVMVRVPGFRKEDMLAKRKEIDRALASIALPGGVAMERPSLSEWTFSARKLRMYALAALLPALLFAAAAIVLSSLRAALGTMIVASCGLAFAAPALLATSSQLDANALLAIAAATCCVTAFAVRAHRERAADSYRLLREEIVPALIATAAVVTMLAILASAPIAARDGWRAPLIAAAAVIAAGMPASLFVTPALIVMLHEIRRRRTAAARAATRPVEWQSNTPPDLVVRNVAKRYAGGFLALREVSFSLTPGVVGLLGPNGAGKTTLLRILTGLLLPTRGQVLHRGVAIAPHNLADYRRLIGFLPQEFNAYAALSAAGFLDYWALERGIADARERRALVERLLVTVGLEHDASRRVRDFSGGMRQRIGIARALIGDPPLLVVDEPTTGLDLESRNRFRDLIVSLAPERIIILSTHIASDVEATASRILLLARGRLQWDGTPDALMVRARGRVFDATVSDADARTLARQYRLTTRLRTPDGVRVRGVVPRDTALPGSPVEPTLEEAYLAEVEGEHSVGTGSFTFLFEGRAAETS